MRQILARKGQEVVNCLSPKLLAKASLHCVAFANSFHIKFDEVEDMQDAIATLKIKEFVWYDSAEEPPAKNILHLKAERTVEERADGRFQAHFYGKFRELLEKKAPSKPWQLRITKGHLMLDIADDIYPLVKFGKDGGRLSATPVLKWAAKGGLMNQEIEDSVNVGLADARNA